MLKPVLVFTYGNPGRGDDVLGSALAGQLQANAQISQEQVEFLTDYQLQIEHALDLENRNLVLFADASVACMEPFECHPVIPAADVSYSTHAMTPMAVLQVYISIIKASPPPCFLLSIKAERFELGAGLSAGATENLRLAADFAAKLLARPLLPEWQKLIRNARNIAA